MELQDRKTKCQEGVFWARIKKNLNRRRQTRKGEEQNTRCQEVNI